MQQLSRTLIYILNGVWIKKTKNRTLPTCSILYQWGGCFFILICVSFGFSLFISKDILQMGDIGLFVGFNSFGSTVFPYVIEMKTFQRRESYELIHLVETK